MMSSLLSTTLTNPTGTPMTSAGDTRPASISSLRAMRAVGALPMAKMHGFSRFAARSIETIAEKCSFEIITRELGDRLLAPENELVVKRVIHTTADFDYVENLRFSAHAVGKGIEALRGGCDIVTDTQMARSGINKTILAQLGGEVHCFMSDPDVAES